MNVELHHLRGFLAIAGERNFTRAAKRVNVSQSTLSRNIRRLEELLGRRLLERTTRQVELTPAGEALYRRIQFLLPQLEEALRLEQGGDSLRVGFTWGFPAEWPQKLFRDFEEETGVAVQVHRSDSPFAGIDCGDVDLAILRGVVDVSGLEVVTLSYEKQIAAVSVRSDLSQREEVSWREIADQEIVLNEVSGTVSLDDWPEDGRPSVSVTCRNFDEWLVAVASGKGVGVAPELVGQQHINSCVSFLAIPDAPRVPLNLVYPKRGGHPLIPRFISMARATVRAREAVGRRKRVRPSRESRRPPSVSPR
ncbi:LysR family transcriptional regulator [Marinactinospora thermotolerans]|uniref:LysR family transcriptional regulator n=1 Tax=Marinactinospora thermotolerans TaxID=531310 RepID=UPI0013564ECC|nr:LysR family transcriptional regulator [Marinactinospora thermotolerans]